MTSARQFQVWAPKAASVAVVVAGQDHRMSETSDGWWSAEVSTNDGDVDYGFRLDDAAEIRPDPRSRRQPTGVHGLSRTFEPSAHRWTDTGWTGRQLAGGLIYELHVGTFTPQGTFSGAIERLDHLVDLGVSFVELLPVNAFNGVHNWGYDGVLWYAVHEVYGGPAGYQSFVDACHQRGLAVIQDVVYNHLGPVGNYLPEFGPYLSEVGGNTWGSSVNLDGPASDNVRRYIIDNAMMWFSDYHVDGLRLDAVHALVDHRAVHLLEDLADETAALSAHLGRPLTLVAESDLNDPKLVTARQAHGYGLDAQWSDDFHHVLHSALTGEQFGYYGDFGSMAAIAKVFRRAFFHDGTLSTFRERRHGRPVDTATTPGWRFVVFAQDHDQIGNRAIGDRLSASLTYGLLAVGAVLLFGSPFTPMLFMGEEWAASTPWQFFTSHPEPDIGKATAEGRKAEFSRMGWDADSVPDPQDPKTFTASKLDWAETTVGDHARMLDLYRQLARLRKELPDITDPRLDRTEVDFAEEAKWLLITRGSVAIGANFSTESADIPLGGPGEVRLATDEQVALSGHHLLLPPQSAAIIATSPS